MIVDNKKKTMTVSKNGKVVKSIPISLGKAKTPSSSGTMIVMEKLRKTVFDTFAELGPKEGYRTNIEYAQRLTWGGEFIHAAPWSVAQQGRTNVSHGCVNMSMANAQWLFSQTMIGDPITVKGTERTLQNGNGWTDWTLSWDEYVKGSAIPYEAPSTERGRLARHLTDEEGPVGNPDRPFLLCPDNSLRPPCRRGGRGPRRNVRETAVFWGREAAETRDIARILMRRMAATGGS
jgi:hypothetical protein